MARVQETQLWKDREARNAFRLNNLEHQVANVPHYTEVGGVTPPTLDTPQPPTCLSSGA